MFKFFTAKQTVSAKMFARTMNDLPQEKDWETDITKMGYKINEKGQFVNIKSGKFFNVFISSSPRSNEIWKESMHFIAREKVRQAAAEQGVKEIYLTGPNGTTIKKTKPVAPHIRILATNLDALKKKKDIVIVVGEHNQDPGIWAYRHLMNDGGIDGGSVVGLIKKLNTIDLKPQRGEEAGTTETQGTTRTDSLGVTIAQGPEDPLALPETVNAESSELHDAYRNDSVAGVTLPRVPGLIVLNPGQLLYSPQLNECMTWPTWLARPKFSGIGSNYKVHEDFNRIPGHRIPREHVDTMFDKVIPQLIGEKVRFWVVGITDGAEHFINHMDMRQSIDHKAKIAELVSGIALMESTHKPDLMRSPALRIFLAMHAKCWIKSDKERGTWINTAGALNPIMSASQLSLSDDEEVPDKKPKGVEENKPPSSVHDCKVPAAYKTGEDPLALPSDTDEAEHSKTGLVGRSGNEQSNIPSSPPASPHHSRANSFEDDIGLQLAEDKPLDMSVLSLTSGDEAAAEGYEYVDPPTPYDYLNTKVSCHTYSAGVDIDEMIFPEVMDLALDFFKHRSELEAHQLKV